MQVKHTLQKTLEDGDVLRNYEVIFIGSYIYICKGNKRVPYGKADGQKGAIWHYADGQKGAIWQRKKYEVFLMGGHG